MATTPAFAVGAATAAKSPTPARLDFLQSASGLALALFMTLSIILQFVVVLGAIWMGARSSGVGLGLWGAVGLLVLIVAFGINPTSPPIDVMLIILAVIMKSRRLRPRDSTSPRSTTRPKLFFARAADSQRRMQTQR